MTDMCLVPLHFFPDPRHATEAGHAELLNHFGAGGSGSLPSSTNVKSFGVTVGPAPGAPGGGGGGGVASACTCKPSPPAPAGAAAGVAGAVPAGAAAGVAGAGPGPPNRTDPVPP